MGHPAHGRTRPPHRNGRRRAPRMVRRNLVPLRLTATPLAPSRIYRLPAEAMAAVTGVPDPRRGGAGPACVVLRPGADAPAEVLIAPGRTVS